ncbi:hypothetical protein CVT26_015623 [Gymnopilus dilepis]|uniref:Protein-S-isoprenylcysteine O-methyltransferase n=1 Tax=Gymnopilus dilepis TaxID=231916 RepID=A0A409YDD8_9AGAR|nr:hypothetical protein CVT26_015623 [Gymnopilus dilepis]
MSLLKIPFILVASYAFVKGFSPPQPPATKEERFKTHGFETLWYSKTPAPGSRLTFMAGLMESATIIAWNYQSHPISRTILSSLVFSGGRPDKLYLSKTSAIGFGMMLTGSLIRQSAYKHMGRYFRFQASIQKDHKLITTGPYSVVRHPSYIGLLVMHLGWVLWYSGDGSWVRESGLWNTVAGKAVVLTYVFGLLCGSLYVTLARMGHEDEALRKTFGKEWDDWAKKVPYKIIPGIY